MSFKREYHVNHRADAPDTTTWEDIFDQKRFGQIANDVYEQMVEAENVDAKVKAQAQNLSKFIEKRDYNPESETSDISGFSELDEEEKNYLQKRKCEMKEKAERFAALPRYGKVIEITRDQYKAEVDTDNPVIIFIFGETAENRRIRELFEQLAQRYSTLKICAIYYSEAVDGLPERQTPLVVVYKDRKPVVTFNGIYQLGGLRVTLDELDFELSMSGIYDSIVKTDPRGNVSGDKFVKAQLEF